VVDLRRKYFRSGLIPLVITSLFLIYIPPSANAEPSTILGTTGTGPQGITIDSSGNIYTANTGPDNVTKITPGGVSTTLGTTGAGPNGITIDSSGNIYTANFNSNNVTKITVFDQAAANAEAARVAAANAEAARVAAANAEAARKAKEQKELTEILALIPSIGELTLSLGETTKSLYSTKCVKGKTTKYVKYGAKCPKGYVKKK